MKKFINRQMFRTMELKQKALNKVKEGKELLQNNDGDSLTTSQLIWILVVVVIVIIVAGLLITFIKSEFFPAFKTKIQEILNLK